MGKVYAFHFIAGPAIVGEVVEDTGMGYIKLKNAVQVNARQDPRNPGQAEIGFMPVGAPINTDEMSEGLELNRSAITYRYELLESKQSHKSLLNLYKQVHSPIMQPVKTILKP